MTTATVVPPPPLADGLAAVLRGTNVPWRTLGVPPAEFLERCAEEDLTGLVYARLRGRPQVDWPPDLSAALAREARAEAARELLRHRELTSVLEVLAAQGIHPILLKGTPLAYTVYPAPSLRPRRDTDLLVPRAQVDAARRAVTELGYDAPPYCDGELLFCQFELGRADAFGVRHAFDFHWKISTQTPFADLLTYEELAASAEPVPALGPHARSAGTLNALLLACIHPVMHHRNEERLLWVYDVHLLASRLSAVELHQFAGLAATKGVAAITAQQLSLARARFGTSIPEAITAALGAVPRTTEPTAAYLQPNRRWHQELGSSIRGLGRWSDRLRLLREVAFPGPSYVLKVYGVNTGAIGAALLSALYLHRGIRGVWRVLTGWK